MKVQELQQALSTELDHNTMRKAVIDMFNSRLLSMEGQMSNVLSIQQVSLEHLRELRSRAPSAPVAMSSGERERRIIEYAKSLE